MGMMHVSIKTIAAGPNLMTCLITGTSVTFPRDVCSETGLGLNIWTQIKVTGNVISPQSHKMNI